MAGLVEIFGKGKNDMARKKKNTHFLNIFELFETILAVFLNQIFIFQNTPLLVALRDGNCERMPSQIFAAILSFSCSSCSKRQSPHLIGLANQVERQGEPGLTSVPMGPLDPDRPVLRAGRILYSTEGCVSCPARLS